MGFFDNILLGFQVTFTPTNLLFCFIGVQVGTLIGVLPGIGPIGTIALLLPATFQVTPASSIIMLAGICYGAMYGGSTTSILVNIPGEAASGIRLGLKIPSHSKKNTVFAPFTREPHKC